MDVAVIPGSPAAKAVAARRCVLVVQAAAKLASGLVSTVWHVVDDMVVTPALQVSCRAALQCNLHHQG